MKDLKFDSQQSNMTVIYMLFGIIIKTNKRFTKIQELKLIQLKSPLLSSIWDDSKGTADETRSIRSQKLSFT